MAYVRVRRSSRNATGRSRARDRARGRKRATPKPSEARKRNRWPTLMPYGKHRGRPWRAIPSEYLEWMLREGHALAHLAAAELLWRRRSRMQPGGAAP